MSKAPIMWNKLVSPHDWSTVGDNAPSHAHAVVEGEMEQEKRVVVQVSFIAKDDEAGKAMAEQVIRFLNDQEEERRATRT